MKLAKIIAASFVIVALVMQMQPEVYAQAEWSSSIRKGTYHWMAEVSDLRDLSNEEKYLSTHLVGGLNVPEGDNAISLREDPVSGFDFFTGDRLNITIAVEGDMLIPPGGDFYLLLLPVKFGGFDFFELLFNHTELLEELTSAEYNSSVIESENAIAYFIYNDVLQVQYEWDTSTGILSRKEVVAPSGLKLIIVRGEGIRFESLNVYLIVGVAITALLGIIIWVVRLRINKYRSTHMDQPLNRGTPIQKYSDENIL